MTDPSTSAVWVQLYMGPAVPAREFHVLENGAALLLDRVGGKIPKTVWRQAFVTLGSFHKVNMVHGDSRINNCILVAGSARWIDFRRSGSVTDPSAETLLKSCFHEQGRPISTQVEQ